MAVAEEFKFQLNEQVDGHAILIRVDLGPGDHWDCTCKRWTFDSDKCLSVRETERVLENWRRHLVLTPGGAGPGDDPAE